MTSMTILIIVISTILKMLMSPPSAVVGWVVSKFELHPKLDSKDVTVTFNGKELEEIEKNIFTDYFNEALFLERKQIFPGNEENFLNPETDVIPFVINVKSKNKEMNFFIYSDEDQFDVIKQWKKKVAYYTLSSESLKKFAISNSINV
ncbi:YfmQ family protein [Psychrobacillus sp. NEAU-3TGS]|nr:YfmQ family protein [Psychrobacillus sp. NEAU-3TGS]